MKCECCNINRKTTLVCGMNYCEKCKDSLLNPAPQANKYYSTPQEKLSTLVSIVEKLNRG